jgi:hypothetical protein
MVATCARFVRRHVEPASVNPACRGGATATIGEVWQHAILAARSGRPAPNLTSANPSRRAGKKTQGPWNPGLTPRCLRPTAAARPRCPEAQAIGERAAGQEHGALAGQVDRYRDRLTTQRTVPVPWLRSRARIPGFSGAARTQERRDGRGELVRVGARARYLGRWGTVRGQQPPAHRSWPRPARRPRQIRTFTARSRACTRLRRPARVPYYQAERREFLARRPRL